MKQRKLEILLEKVRGFDSPDVTLEQYPTPALLAAELLHFAYMKGDLTDTVYDLGCGTGMLAIGAKILGAERVIGFDSDPAALKIAKENAERLGVEVEFECMDVRQVRGHAHTVVMNPPFGAQVKGSDRPFLKTALKVGDVTYSIHNSGSLAFIKKFIEPAIITEWYNTGFPIKRTFKFHKKDVERIEVEIYRIIKENDQGE
ncbi:METTL5 family protein [Methanococcoides methylutens]|uniref:Ribosomal protein L11 methyltransferase n=1 Tax=Methanococcoides methylutens MM1 TaxID=1434104 RepID=A0A0E3X106_METMT|nr:METTL5 family protein [Methanococcoides methylutens]AKB85974.1 ribosomal protein L11 methyltransferase [Methanococcoides methylutens MM1]